MRSTIELLASAAIRTGFAVMLFGIPVLATAQSAVERSSRRPLAEDSLPSEVARQRHRVLNGLMGPVDAVGRPPIRWTLAERMAHYHVPAVSIAVIDHERIAWTAAQGVMSSAGTDSVAPATLFQAASLSKPITVSGMLRLVDQGRLSLDTDVNQYLTTWKLPVNEFTRIEKVTLRRLASHTAGTSPSGFTGYRVTDSIPSVAQILQGAPPANSPAVRVDTVPGSTELFGRRHRSAPAGNG